MVEVENFNDLLSYFGLFIRHYVLSTFLKLKTHKTYKIAKTFQTFHQNSKRKQKTLINTFQSFIARVPCGSYYYYYYCRKLSELFHSSISKSVWICSRNVSNKEVHLRSFPLMIVVLSTLVVVVLVSSCRTRSECPESQKGLYHLCFLGSNKRVFLFRKPACDSGGGDNRKKAHFIPRGKVPKCSVGNIFGNIWTGNGECRKHIGSDDKIYRDGLLREYF